MVEFLSGIPMGWLGAVAVALIAVLVAFASVRPTEHERPAGVGLSFDPPEEESGPMVAVADLELEYRQRSATLELRGSEIGAQRQLLEGREYELLELEPLLIAADPQERTDLAAIIKLSKESSAAALAEGLGKAGSHVVRDVVRAFVVDSRGVSYRKVLGDVAAKLKLPKLAEAATDWDLERQILTAVLEKMLAEMSPEQREAILAELGSKQGRSVGVGAGTAALVVANLSGFALYTAASATVAAITGAIGLTLPFATYMGLSSVIATVTGPVGWAALGVWAIAVLGGANYKKTLPAVVLVGTVRTRLIAERDQELEALAGELEALEQRRRTLRTLRPFLDTLGPVPEGHLVRECDVPRYESPGDRSDH